MSVGFQFTADLNDKNQFLQSVENLAFQHGYVYSAKENQACVNFCRMGDMEFTFAPEEENPDGSFILTAECVTSLAGAGFHAAAIDFMDALYEATMLDFEIEDETEYLEHRSFRRMRQEHFYPWLSTLVDVCREEGENTALSNFCVCWDIDQYVPEDIPGTVVTPLGRYHIAQLVDQMENEGIEVLASEFFIWNERERNGRFYLNSALSVLWEDCYFMPGRRSPIDKRVNQSFIRFLEQAAALDPSLPMPKPEYEMICRLEDHEPIDLSGFPDYQSDYPVGYRRNNVVHRMGNTDIITPGNFLKEEEEDSVLWYDAAEDGWHSLRVSAFQINKGAAEFSENLFEQLPCIPSEFKTGEGRCRAAFAGKIQDESGVYYQSIAQAICARQVTLLTASYQRPEDAEWAMALFQDIHSFRSVK